MMTRREFLAWTALAVRQCSGERRSGGAGRLRARPAQPSLSIEPGRYPLGLAADRDGLLYVPGSCRPGAVAGLIVMLHGAGGRAHVSEAWAQMADQFGFFVLAPDSRRETWDVVLGQLGPDVDFIDAALAHTFARCAVDPRRLAIGGFSDGASYALSLGTINGDLFSHVIAFSPGFIAPGLRRGSPRVFISHGTQDRVLPIERTSRRIVPQLQEQGYRVTYREFDGGHAVPEATARQAFEWLAR
jgi:predicted esterase